MSRKLTQLWQINKSTAFGYIREITRKYKPGSTIARVPSSGDLAGQQIQGQMILEVPVQTQPVPQAILDAAIKADVIIRDIAGRVY